MISQVRSVENIVNDGEENSRGGYALVFIMRAIVESGGGVVNPQKSRDAGKHCGTQHPE
jgi:hypothetical protein